MGGYGGIAPTGTGKDRSTGYGGVSVAAKVAAKAPAKKKGPSVLSRIFDVVQRPLNTVEGGIIGGWGGLVHGASGTQKYSGAMLADKLGVHNKFARGALGFALDVGLDPLTYLSFGTSALAEHGAVAGLKGAEALGAGAKGVEALGTAEKVAKGGSELAAANTGRKGLVRGLLAASKDAAPTAGKLDVKFLGKTIGSSEKAYDVARGATAPVRNSGLGQLLATSFKAGHGLPKDVHNLERTFAGRGVADMGDFARQVEHVFKGTSAEEQRLVRRAVQENALDSLPPHLREAGDFTMQALHETNRLGSGISKMDEVGQGTLPGFDNIKGDAPKFDDIAKYKGGPTHDRAPQNLFLQRERVVRQHYYNQFTDEVAKRFPDAEKHTEIANALRKSKDIFGIQGDVSSKWQHYMNSALTPWKKFQTVYSPGHHARNLLGDGYNTYLAGMHPKNWTKSATVLAHTTEDKAIELGGTRMTTAEANRLYRKGGLETSFTNVEGLGATKHPIFQKLTHASETREKYGRMALFLDGMDKNLAKGMHIDRAVEESSARVRKYLFDYADITPLERKARNILPFYTWTRKELPLVLEHTLTNPGKIGIVPKGTRAIAMMMGGDPNNRDDPFPGLNQALPPWFRDQSVIPLSSHRISSPGLPVDLLNIMSPHGAYEQLGNSLNPLIKQPLELARGKTIPYDTNQKQPLGRYLAANLPYGNLIRNSPSSLGARTTNIVTGAGIHDVTPPVRKKVKGTKTAAQKVAEKAAQRNRVSRGYG